MFLVDRQIARPAVDLARAGMDDRNRRRHRPAQLEELQLRGAIDREIVLGRGHRVHVTCLRRQIEQQILSSKQVAQCLAVADIGDVDPHPVADIRDIGEIAAGLRRHAVDEQHLGAKPDKPPGQRRADQADPAGDHRALAAEGGETRIGSAVHNSSLSGASLSGFARFVSIC